MPPKIEELREQTYGYHVFYGRDGEKFLPKLRTDQFLMVSGWADIGGIKETSDNCFYADYIYRRPIDVGEGFELVPLDEIINVSDECLLIGDSEWKNATGCHGDTPRESFKEHGDIFKAFRRRKSAKGETTPVESVQDLKAVHRLKCWPEYFQAIIDGKKTFELRKNDRDYRAGDDLLLLEWNPTEANYTGRTCRVNVPYILEGGEFGIPNTHCIMSIAKGAAK